MNAINEQPWQEMTPAITKEILTLTANTYRVHPVDLSTWLTNYTLRFNEGPDVFIPWYKYQMALWQSGDLGFQPYYPHEVYPALLGGASWLYDHPAWKRP